MKKVLCSSLFFAIVCSLVARPEVRTPHAGYACPAGGQVGTTVQMVIGGQNLHGLKGGIISGQGVEVVEARLFRPIRRFSNIARNALKPMFINHNAGRDMLFIPPRQIEALKKRKRYLEPDETIPGAGLSRRELAEIVKKLSPLEYELLQYEVFKQRNALQMSPAISQIALVTIKIAPDAKPGMRKLWLKSSLGLSNPVNIMVGKFPEKQEEGFKLVDRNKLEPGKKPALAIPSLMNGQIMPGEVDRYKFTAKKGKKYRFELYGRALVPFLSDAVPGWFQPVISVSDDKGKQLAYADDYLYKPDPILLFTAPEDGQYELQIRDSIYRGREDFVYRLAVTEVDVATGPDKLPEPDFKLAKVSEVEPNDKKANPQKVAFPSLICGTINKPGDVDNFSISGKAGDEVVMEVIARRLGSPVDSRLNVYDASGKKIQWNDDFERLNVGLKTHHSDSYIRFKLPADGEYTVQLSDTQHRGGAGCDYFLRLDHPKPDFKVYMQPSVINLEYGVGTAFLLHVVREDGFDKDINLKLKKAPKECVLSGTRLPAGTKKIYVVLTVPSKIKKGDLELEIDAVAEIDGKEVVHKVIPSDEIMQAFLWTHVVPAEEFRVDRSRRRWKVAHLAPKKQQIELTPGGTAEIIVKSNKVRDTQRVFFELDNPPKGVVLKEMVPVKDLVSKLVIAADANAKPVAENLVIRCLVEGKYEDKKTKQQRTYVSDSGVLSAVPITIKAKPTKSKDLASAKQ